MFKEERMDSKEALMQAATALINEKGESAEEITVREICKRANVGLGLVNYHFGNKDRLIALCVERMINGIVDSFCSMQEEVCGLTPFEKLTYLGNMTLPVRALCDLEDLHTFRYGKARRRRQYASDVSGVFTACVRLPSGLG